ncbi:MAG: 3-phosphoshikimate 1-carboxyvinyltransferase [Rhodospirillales bacterium]|nr:3-phosphoshikimate 1-carboxyvinyltransferase [Rhodospirillales bacterium]
MRGDSEDPFINTFFSRISAEVAASFDAPQLDAIKRAFSARARGVHAIDVRLSVPLGHRSWYVVFLAGRERRTIERSLLEQIVRPLGALASAIIVVLFLLTFAAGTAAILYTGKRALGIDVFPGIDMLPDRTIERLLR